MRKVTVILSQYSIGTCTRAADKIRKQAVPLSRKILWSGGITLENMACANPLLLFSIGIGQRGLERFTAGAVVTWVDMGAMGGRIRFKVSVGSIGLYEELDGQSVQIMVMVGGMGA